jgi:nucleolar GTP-binding protein
MNFQDLVVVENADTLLDGAFKLAGKRVSLSRHGLRRLPQLEKNRRLERERLTLIANTLQKNLERIPKSFPNVDGLPEFYARLVETTLDPDRLKKSLAATAWAGETVSKLARQFSRDYAKANTKEELLVRKRQAIGRLASVLHQIKKNLSYLEKARAMMRSWPSVKPGLFTIAIAGFPNVGKSTLLGKLTPARPQIAAYAFTTKGLNVGYFTHRHHQLQFIDTPGTLARERMNSVEKQAELAMKYAANLIVYVYDPTETYAFEEQEKLEGLVREYGKETILYLSKTDKLDEQELAAFRKKVPSAIVSAEKLKAKILEKFEQDYIPS